LKVSGDPLVIVPKEYPAGKTAGKTTSKADTFSADSLQGKPGKPGKPGGSPLSGSAGLGQTKTDIRDNPARQTPPGNLPDKTAANLVSLLKLPPDSLSRAVISFARFFSLPLEPKLLSALRREALSSRAAGREAAALGAAAAADKGITLSERALAEYAAAIEGKSFAQEDAATVPASAEKPQNTGQRESPPEDRQQSNDTAEREPGQKPGSQETGNNSRNSGGSREKHQPDLQGKNSQLNGNIQDDGTELQRRVTKILENNPFLDLINRIPGKNGQWIVVPFSFCEDGLDFSVTLRILLNNDPCKTLVSGRLSADIKVSRSGREQKRWLVTLERPEKNTEAGAELCVFSGSGRFSAAEKKQVRLELAAALDVPFDKVSIREADLSDEPVFTGLRESALRSVDEDV